MIKVDEVPKTEHTTYVRTVRARMGHNHLKTL
jgi:hypothetical protein